MEQSTSNVVNLRASSPGTGRLIRWKNYNGVDGVSEIIGGIISRATACRRIEAGTFPKFIRLSPQIVVWRENEIRAWLEDPAAWGERD